MITTKYLITLAASFLAWIVPVNIPKTPKVVVFFSFIASGSGYLYALSLATPLADKRWFDEQQRTQEREVLLHDFALGEYALKQALELQYLGQAQVEEEAIAIEQQQQLNSAPTQKLLPDALPEHLQLILQVASSKGGIIKVRDVQRAPGLANKFKAEEIKSYFLELQSRGYGSVTSDGRSYSFQLTRSLS
jgi:hypothetical protein